MKQLLYIVAAVVVLIALIFFVRYAFKKLGIPFPRVSYVLQQFDGIWSVPLSFGAFWLAGVVFQYLFGYETGTYSMEFFQPFFLACAIVIGATNAAIFGIYFTFRGLYRWFFGECKGGELKNYSKENWLKLTEWQRFKLGFFVFFFFVAAVITVYMKLV